MIKILPLDDSRFLVLGLPHRETEMPLHRLPKDKLEKISLENEQLIELSKHTAGLTFMFKTNAKKCVLMIDLLRASVMNHMPMTAESGFDLYHYDQNQDTYHFMDVSRALHQDSSYNYTFRLIDDKDMHTYVMYAPLYNGINHIELSFEDHVIIEKPTFKPKKRILIYGTSITQGACASRSGLAYPARLSRMSHSEVINYGFSGNALGEKAMIDIICTYNDLDLIVIDYEANAGAVGLLMKTFEPMIDKLVSQFKQQQIVILGRIPSPLEYFDKGLTQRRLNHDTFMKDVLKRYPKIIYISGDQLLPNDHIDTTVDGIHLNDSGFEYFAKNLYSFIKDAL